MDYDGLAFPWHIDDFASSLFRTSQLDPNLHCLIAYLGVFDAVPESRPTTSSTNAREEQAESIYDASPEALTAGSSPSDGLIKRAAVAPFYDESSAKIAIRSSHRRKYGRGDNLLVESDS
ncbi:MAG TPA: hypothetical protein VGQ19_16325 [Burkholderiales bacterium]|nr:hypothetical protein [Burkholderiales bacterium]